MPALTLGSHDANSNDIARETYIARLFRRWVSQYQKALSVVQDVSVGRIGSVLRQERVVESNRINKALYPGGSEKILVGLLWDKAARDPNYWRKREAKALTAGRTYWRYLANERNNRPRLKGVKARAMGARELGQ